MPHTVTKISSDNNEATFRGCCRAHEKIKRLNGQASEPGSRILNQHGARGLYSFLANPTSGYVERHGSEHFSFFTPDDPSDLSRSGQVNFIVSVNSGASPFTSGGGQEHACTLASNRLVFAKPFANSSAWVWDWSTYTALRCHNYCTVYTTALRFALWFASLLCVPV